MARRMGSLLVILVLLAAAPLVAGRSVPLPSASQQQAYKKPIQTQRPFNIAHRGASGEFPEETVEAYHRAIEVGADFIETDVSATKDGKLICFHDVTLDDTTDVVNYTKFADRKRTYEVERVNVTGFFTVDFTLEEIQSLRINQRFDTRDPSYNGKFGIITFDEFIQIALNADRVVGIYPECKNPVFMNQHVKWPEGKTFEDEFTETLLKHGYKGKYLSKDWQKQPLLIQSFAPTALKKISKLTDSPLVFLIDDVTVNTQDNNLTFAEITSNEYFKYLKSIGVVGLGPWKDTIAVPDAQNFIQTPTDFVARAHAHGLQVHPYTFRNENSRLKYNYHLDPYVEYSFWTNEIGVDGFFTDFPRTLHMYQEWTSPLNVTKAKSAAELISKIADLVDSYTN
ncbi:hypothetical protein KC19_9G012400 [Ceratodon purpureus]|uniref:glycerophosphodiester phosphodiesterase n=1 Tax=Ceratodon purpureus TaxID=3225 RepID=A0A8T0GQQ0_CERPU|nr:hypothetical protein KC19_9G012400 [Ceratodon purpureus]